MRVLREIAEQTFVGYTRQKNPRAGKTGRENALGVRTLGYQTVAVRRVKLPVYPATGDSHAGSQIHLSSLRAASIRGRSSSRNSAQRLRISPSRSSSLTPSSYIRLPRKRREKILPCFTSVLRGLW